MCIFIAASAYVRWSPDDRRKAVRQRLLGVLAIYYLKRASTWYTIIRPLGMVLKYRWLNGCSSESGAGVVAAIAVAGGHGDKPISTVQFNAEQIDEKKLDPVVPSDTPVQSVRQRTTRLFAFNALNQLSRTMNRKY